MLLPHPGRLGSKNHRSFEGRGLLWSSEMSDVDGEWYVCVCGHREGEDFKIF